jgi:O-antigen/teichoic acid export membrane protein
MWLLQAVLWGSGLWGGANVLALLWLNSLTSALQLGVAALVIGYATAPHSPTPVTDLHVASVLRAALPFGVGGMVGALQARLLLTSLGRLAVAEEVGRFAAALRWTEAAKLLPNAWYGAWFIQLAAPAPSPRTFSRPHRLLLVYGVAVSAVLIIGAPLWVGAYGNGFGAAAGVLVLGALGLPFSVARANLTLRGYAQQQAWRYTALNSVVLILSVPLALLSITLGGAFGAAAAGVTSEMLWWIGWFVITKP